MSMSETFQGPAAAWRGGHADRAGYPHTLLRMIPGFVAGRFSFEECHIDLARLCATTGTRLIEGEAIGIDRAGQTGLLNDQPSVPYDVLSIDVGSAPDLDALPGAATWAIPVKPIADLGRRWLDSSSARKSWLGPLDIVVIGAAPGGVELALAIDHRLREVAKAPGCR